MIAGSKELNKGILAYFDKLDKHMQEAYESNYVSVINMQAVRNIIEGGGEFSFAQNPALNRGANKIIKQLQGKTAAIIGTAMQTAAESGAQTATDTHKAQLSDELQQTAIDTTRTAAGSNNQLQQRNISERVWKAQEGVKSEIEIIVQNGIKEGKTPDEVASSVTQYLREPNKLFRRVKNKETGELEWSTAAKTYHPGRGVYRSSYANAMRLARTEFNIGYNTALLEGIRRDPTCIGYEVKLSNNHTTKLPNGKIKRLKDICDKLQGRYPKWFEFKGWHPQCRCQIIPIYIDKKEWGEYLAAKYKGQTYISPNEVKDLPQGLINWVASTNVNLTKNPPYFITDNIDNLRQWLEGGTIEPIAPQPADILPTATRQLQEAQASETQQFTEDDVKITADFSNYNKLLTEGRDSEAVTYGLTFVKIIDKLKAEENILGKVPNSWRADYVECVKAINELTNNDILNLRKNIDIRAKIYFAENMLELANSNMATTYGLDKLSNKMPYTFFEKLKKANKVDITEKMINQEIFSKLSRFIPMEIDSTREGSAYNKKEKKVVLGELKKRNTYIDAVWKVAVHEYGHAYDYNNETDKLLSTQHEGEIDKIFSDFRSSIEKSVNTEYKRIKAIRKQKFAEIKEKYVPLVNGTKDENKLKIYYKASENERQYIKELCGGVSDAIQAADRLHSHPFPKGLMGHDQSYYCDSKAMPNVEFFAHMCECKYGGNEIFKEMYPTIYQRIISYFS